MKLLILGGTGAMGVYLVDFLANNRENQIVVTSRSSHESKRENVRFVQGNARENAFVEELLKDNYDVVVDFMNYNIDDFASRYVKMLAFTGQYIWFSSSRVYAYSERPLTEESPRLLETTKDHAFLSTNRYALRKARQEEMLKNSGFHNYTIIRPYVTYSEDRLQLGIYEKEQWLYRILEGKSLVINKNILQKNTTLSYGKDVAYAISKLVGNKNALGQTVQIASGETMKWSEVISLYMKIIHEKTGITPKLYQCSTMLNVEELYEGGYNTIYDREWDRSFDSSLVNKLIGEDVRYTEMKQGLRQCLEAFLDGNRKFRTIDWDFEARQDVLTNEITLKENFSKDEDFEKYSINRSKTHEELIGENGQIEPLIFQC